MDAAEISSVEQSLKDLEAKLANEAVLSAKVKEMQAAIATKDIAKVKVAITAAQEAGVNPTDIGSCRVSMEVYHISCAWYCITIGRGLGHQLGWRGEIAQSFFVTHGGGLE